RGTERRGLGRPPRGPLGRQMTPHGPSFARTPAGTCRAPRSPAVHVNALGTGSTPGPNRSTLPRRSSSPACPALTLVGDADPFRGRVELRTVSTSPRPPGVRAALVTAVDAAARAVNPVAGRRVSGGRHDPGAASTGTKHSYGRTEVELPLNA